MSKKAKAKKAEYVSTSKKGVELSRADVRDIFKRAHGGKETQLEIAKSYKISTRYVSFIATGRVRHQDTADLFEKFDVKPKGRYGNRKLKLAEPTEADLHRRHQARLEDQAKEAKPKRREMTPEQREAKNAKDRERRAAKKAHASSPNGVQAEPNAEAWTS